MKAGMAGMAIAVAEARNAIKSETDMLSRLKTAMRATRNHWIITDEDERFRVAVAAAILESPPDEAARIKAELDALGRLSAAFEAARRGVLVDFASIAIDIEKPIGLMEMWRSIAQSESEDAATARKEAQHGD